MTEVAHSRAKRYKVNHVYSRYIQLSEFYYLHYHIDNMNEV